MTYPDGSPLRYRCPYCLRATAIDPEPGCCGETHAELIPLEELADYAGEPDRRAPEWDERQLYDRLPIVWPHSSPIR